MKTDAEIFRENFTLAFNASPFPSRRSLSVASNVSPSLVTKIISGESTNPGILPLKRMTDNMGTSLNQLLPPKQDQTERPKTQDFFARYRPGTARLSDFTDLVEYCDLYKQPKAGRSRIVRVGSRSVLGEKTQLFDPTIHQIEYESWSREVQASICRWQERAWSEHTAVEYQYFSASYLAAKRNIAGPIVKSACRVSDDLFSDTLEDRLVVFVEQIWQNPIH